MKNVALHERSPLLSATIQAGTDAVQGRRVLLIDDLWETGSTRRRVAEVLGQMGATEVKPVVVYVAPTKQFRTIRTSVDRRDLLAQGDLDSVERIVNELHVEVSHIVRLGDARLSRLNEDPSSRNGGSASENESPDRMVRVPARRDRRSSGFCVNTT